MAKYLKKGLPSAETDAASVKVQETVAEIIADVRKRGDAAVRELSERERTVFELYVVEGFSKGAVARISGVPTDEVPRIAEKVKEHIRQAIAANQESKERREKAS